MEHVEVIDVVSLLNKFKLLLVLNTYRATAASKETLNVLGM